MRPQDQIGVEKARCSLLILLATSRERSELEQAARERGIGFEKIRQSPLSGALWFGQIGDEQVIAVGPSREGGRVVMRSYGRAGTASRGIRLREVTGAQGIVQIGMAFGVDSETQQLGDVLVSTSLIPYDNRTVRHDPTHPSGYVVDYREAKREPARPSLVQLFTREAERDHAFKVHKGALLSGAARIHSATFRDELIRGVPTGEDPIVGGEMEAVGLIAASTTDEPIWCVVKGISDFGDENRDEVIQMYRAAACRNAAEFVLSALQNGPRTP